VSAAPAACSTPFSGGSGILPAGKLTAKQVLWYGIICFAIAVPIGIFFAVAEGWLLLPLLALGGICILLYTSLILKNFFPEWSPGLGLGILPVLGAYFVQSGNYSWTALIASVPSGFLVLNLLLLNEFPDVEADLIGHKKTLPITAGKRWAAVVYSTCVILTYLWIIGAVIFLVLIAIQYVVINHGAVRISEVTARFTLDALPGKQMSIDSDLSTGLIDENEARRRRKMLSAEAEFYGAMDGASRFTQRDAVASILITGINILAGFLIGVLQHGMDLSKALETYTVLTIGDGLVTVIPALMISISGGLIVTRAGSETRLGADFGSQIFGAWQPLLLASGVLTVLAAIPSMPKIPFLLLAGGAGAAGWSMRRKERRAAKAPDAKPAAKENLETLLRVEPLAVESEAAPQPSGYNESCLLLRSRRRSRKCARGAWWWWWTTRIARTRATSPSPPKRSLRKSSTSWRLTAGAWFASRSPASAAINCGCP